MPAPAPHGSGSCAHRWLRLRSATAGESGQTMAEYALILGLVALTAIAASVALGAALNGAIQAVAGNF